MNAHAYSLNPIEREYQQRDASAYAREQMIRAIPGLIAGPAFIDALLWVVDEHVQPFRDGDPIEFARRLDSAIVTHLCESGPLWDAGWVDLTTDDQQIIAAELRAELRRYRASRPIPTSVAAVVPPRAPAFRSQGE